ncbi:MAG: methylamine dehydrogenase accessory protein MauD [Hyphomicrobiaceae bacterium]|jgi:methylamine dehydrogenase accessory protein MauD
MNETLLISNVLLWVVVVALAFIVLALIRQVGVLHERLAPAGAMLNRSGPEVGEPAPTLEVPTLAGTPVSIGGPADDGRRTLVFFLSPTCPVCKVLLPTVLRVARSQVPPLRVVLASDGDEEEHRRFVSDHDLEEMPYVVSAALGISFEVAKLPYAVLIDAEGILRAKGLVNTREHLESLFEAERLGVASIQDWLADHADPAELDKGDGPEGVSTGGGA